jgi:hypothetical protein
MIEVNNIPKSTDPRRIDLEGRVLVAHQAEFMPWLGFISKATMGDVFLILDDTQFKKKYFENRNKIRFPNKEGWIWLNVPIKSKDNLPNMLDVEFSEFSWMDKHLSTIRNSYSRAPYFNPIFRDLELIYTSLKSNKLVDFNVEMIRYAFKCFKINMPIVRISEINPNEEKIKTKGTEMVISLVKTLNAKVLVAGVSGREYLNVEQFKEESIGLVFQDFKHPVYNQMHGNFLPYMSFIDLLFNYSQEDAIKILGKSTYKTV